MSNEPLEMMAYSVKMAMKITGLGRTTIWKAIQDGQLRCYRVGRRVLFSPDHIRAFLGLHEKQNQAARPTRGTSR